MRIIQIFPDEGPYHIETCPLISIANQWTGFYIIGTSAMKELIWTPKLHVLKIYNTMPKLFQNTSCQLT